MHCSLWPQVLDDKSRLKAAIKRREQQKKKSAKKWDGIKKGIEEQQAAKQVCVCFSLCAFSTAALSSVCAL